METIDAKLERLRLLLTEMGGVVIGMVIMFTVISWFPSWIIIFIGMLAGFGVLIMLGRNM